MEGDTSYLFLPLAHAFAILIQFATFELGAVLAYWSRDAKMIIADITQVNPSFFPSVPRMFEKIYTLATSQIEDKEGLQKAVEVGVKVRMMREAGEEVPEELQAAFDKAEESLFKNVRGLFGTNIRECVTGAAPIASEILEFFYAARRACDGGLRDDRDLHERDGEPPGRQQLPVRLGGQAAEGRRGQDRR